MRILPGYSLTLSCVLLLALFALCIECNVVYRRFHRPPNSNPKVKEIREIFQTVRRPPSLSLSDADIEWFLKSDANFQRQPKRPYTPFVTKRSSSTKKPFIIQPNDFENVNPDYSVLLPSVTSITTLKPSTTSSLPSTTTTTTTTTSTEQPITSSALPIYPFLPTESDQTIFSTTTDDYIDEYSEELIEDDFSLTTDYPEAEDNEGVLGDMNN